MLHTSQTIFYLCRNPLWFPAPSTSPNTLLSLVDILLPGWPSNLPGRPPAHGPGIGCPLYLEYAGLILSPLQMLLQMSFALRILP